MERREITEVFEEPGFDTFVGSYTHSLDSKKRLTIPSDWRDKLAEPDLFVLPGVNAKCLSVFTAREMGRRLEKFRSISIADKRAQQFARAFFARANRAPWDSQGRIRVTDELLNWAGLSNQVVLAGVGPRFELWAPERWSEVQPDIDMDMESFGEAAEFIGF